MANVINSQTNGITLLPCPFCGCEDIDEYEGEYGNGVYCMNCGAMMGEQIHREFHVHERVEYEQAAEAWNTRAADHGFAMAVYEGNLLGKCSECGDAIELANVRTMPEGTLESNNKLRERIAELDKALEVKRLRAVLDENSISARDALIRDMWKDLVDLQGGYEELGYKTSLPEFADRMRELGIEVE